MQRKSLPWIATIASALVAACGGHAVDLDRPSSPTTVVVQDAAVSDDPITLPDRIIRLAVDDSRIYWVSTGGKIASCDKTNCTHAITTYAEHVSGASILVANGHVYWNEFESGVDIGGTVFSCPTSGCSGGPTRIVRDPALSESEPYWGSLAADTDYVYWSSDLDIYRCKYSGCGATPELVARQSSTMYPVAFQGDYLYWPRIQTVFGDPSAILRAPKDGSAPPSTFVETETFSIATDSSNVYWIAAGDPDSIESCPLAGCGAGGPVQLATGIGRGTELVVLGPKLYWLDLNVSLDPSIAVHSCPVTGCGSSFATLTPNDVQAFAVDEQYAYWNEAGVGDASPSKTIHRTAL